jgi:hypothetical protein
MLRSRKLRLLLPDTWHDENDKEYLRAYRRRSKFRSVLALCFAEGTETFHHWRVFTSGSDGVRVHFRRIPLINAVGDQPGVTYRDVDYRRVDDFDGRNPPIEDLPFLKRHPFRDEREFRLVYSSKQGGLKSKDFDLPLSCITRITLSPWLPEPLVEDVKATIKFALSDNPDGETGKHIRIYRSKLVEYDKWIALANQPPLNAPAPRRRKR